MMGEKGLTRVEALGAMEMKLRTKRSIFLMKKKKKKTRKKAIAASVGFIFKVLKKLP